MEFHQFKDLKISSIGFGAAALSQSGAGYGFGSLKEPAQRLLDHQIDLGINLIDTAPIYGFGESERVLGDCLKAKRHDCNIVSKCGVHWHANRRVDMTNEPSKCVSQLEDSLRRLKTDYIDIYMIHWPDKNISIMDTLEALEKEKAKGKIRYLGLCNTNNHDLKQAQEEFEIGFIQSEANLFNNGFKDLDCDDLFKMSWGTFDKGILTGRVTLDRSFEKSDCRSWAPWWKKSDWKEKVARFNNLNNFLVKENIDPASFAINYNLKILGIKNVLCGFKSTADSNICFDIVKEILMTGHKLLLL